MQKRIGMKQIILVSVLLILIASAALVFTLVSFGSASPRDDGSSDAEYIGKLETIYNKYRQLRNECLKEPANKWMCSRFYAEAQLRDVYRLAEQYNYELPESYYK